MRNEFGPEANIFWSENSEYFVKEPNTAKLNVTVHSPCPLFLHHHPLLTVHCLLPNAYSPLSTPHCPLSTVHFLLSTAHCPLPLSTVHHVSPLHLWFYLLLARRSLVKNNSDLPSTDTDSVSAADWQWTEIVCSGWAVGRRQWPVDSNQYLCQWTVGSRLWDIGHWIVGTGW
jgi:hypothetical protein